LIPAFPCFSINDPSLRVFFRQNDDLLMKEFFVFEGMPV